MQYFGETKSAISEIKVDNLPNQKGVTADGLLSGLVPTVIAVGGLVAVAVLIYGGVKFNTAQGQPDKVKQASQIVAFGAVGLVIVLLSAAIAAFASGIIGGAANGGSSDGDSSYVQMMEEDLA